MVLMLQYSPQGERLPLDQASYAFQDAGTPRALFLWLIEDTWPDHDENCWYSQAVKPNKEGSQGQIQSCIEVAQLVQVRITTCTEEGYNQDYTAQ